MTRNADCKLGWVDCGCLDDPEYADDWHRGQASKSEAEVRAAYKKAADQLEVWCFDDIQSDSAKALRKARHHAEHGTEQSELPELQFRLDTLEDVANEMRVLKATLWAHVDRIDKAIDELNDTLEG